MKIIIEKDEYQKLKQYVLTSKDFLIDVEKIIKTSEKNHNREGGFIEIKELMELDQIEHASDIEDLLI